MTCMEVQVWLADLGDALESRDHHLAEEVLLREFTDQWHDFHEECRVVLGDANRSVRSLLEEFGEHRSWFPSSEWKNLEGFSEDELARLHILKWRLRKAVAKGFQS